MGVGSGKGPAEWREDGNHREREISRVRCFTYPFPHCPQNTQCKYSSLFSTYVLKIPNWVPPPTLSLQLVTHTQTRTHTHTHTHPFHLLSLKNDDIYNQRALPVCTAKAKINAEGWCNVAAEQRDQNTRWSAGGKAKKYVCAWSLHKSP